MKKILILEKISAINHALDSIANEEFQKLSLTKGKYQYLKRISDHPEITQTELSELMRIDKATVSRAIAKLVQDQLVLTQIDEYNNKKRHLRLTEKGQQYAKIITRETHYSTKQALQGLDEAEVKQLSLLLAQVEKNTGQAWKDVQAGQQRKY